MQQDAKAGESSQLLARVVGVRSLERTCKEVERGKTAQLPEIDETPRFLGEIGLGKIEETAPDEQTRQINEVALRKHLRCLAGPTGFSIDIVTLEKWSGRRDSNPRPSGPKPDALPGCATPRPADYPTAQPPRAHTLARTHRKALNASTPHRRRTGAFVSVNAQQQLADPNKSAEKCRVAATALRTRNTGPGVATAGTTVHPGGKNNLTIAYNDTSRTQKTTCASQSQAVNCTATFDVNGNTVAIACLGTLSGSKTTITATEKICR